MSGHYSECTATVDRTRRKHRIVDVNDADWRVRLLAV